MSIILFTLIGIAINAGDAYWICLCLYVTFKLTSPIIKTFMEASEDIYNGR